MCACMQLIWRMWGTKDSECCLQGILQKSMQRKTLVVQCQWIRKGERQEMLTWMLSWSQASSHWSRS